MLAAAVQRLLAQRAQHGEQSRDRIVGALGIGDMALNAAHREVAGQRTAPPDLQGVAEPLRIGRLADQAGIELLAAPDEPVEHLARAVDRRTFLVAGDQAADRPGRPMLLEKTRGCGDEAGDRALHVDRATPVQHAVDDLAGERIDAPAGEIARRHDVGVTGKAEIGRPLAHPGVQIADRRRAVLLERQPVAGETQPLQRMLDHVERAVVLRRHARTADQRLRQSDRIGQQRHARSSSLIEVLARVFASTRLTITAQARLGPGRPSGSGGPGKVPGTTTA